MCRSSPDGDFSPACSSDRGNTRQCLPSLSLSTSRIPLEDGNDLPHGKGNTNGDWISFLLALAISHLPTGVADIDVAIWSRAISLLLTGVLILSSLTQVLRSLSRILRLTSKTAGAGFLLLSLGQLFVSPDEPRLESAHSGSPPMSSRYWCNYGRRYLRLPSPKPIHSPRCTQTLHPSSLPHHPLSQPAILCSQLCPIFEFLAGSSMSSS